MSSNKYQAEVILEVDKEIATATNNDEDYWVRMVVFLLTNGASTRGPSWLVKTS